MSSTKEIREQNAERQKQIPVTNVSNLNSEIHNPCLKEQILTHKCLSDNNYDRDACQLHFMNYQNCKDFWYQISRERRRKGIKPNLPTPAERPQILDGYMNANTYK